MLYIGANLVVLALLIWLAIRLLNSEKIILRASRISWQSVLSRRTPFS